jgi:hypothetical protein
VSNSGLILSCWLTCLNNIYQYLIP